MVYSFIIISKFVKAKFLNMKKLYKTGAGRAEAIFFIWPKVIICMKIRRLQLHIESMTIVNIISKQLIKEIIDIVLIFII